MRLRSRAAVRQRGRCRRARSFNQPPCRLIRKELFPNHERSNTLFLSFPWDHHLGESKTGILLEKTFLKSFYLTNLNNLNFRSQMWLQNGTMNPQLFTVDQQRLIAAQDDSHAIQQVWKFSLSVFQLSSLPVLSLKDFQLCHSDPKLLVLFHKAINLSVKEGWWRSFHFFSYFSFEADPTKLQSTHVYHYYGQPTYSVSLTQTALEGGQPSQLLPTAIGQAIHRNDNSDNFYYESPSTSFLEVCCKISPKHQPTHCFCCKR